jgi:threonine dehydratase
VFAASPSNSMAMIESIRAGRVVETSHLPTLSDATAGGVEPGAITLELCAALVDECLAVDEDAIGASMRTFIDAEHQLLEGSAGVAVAALVAARGRFAGQNVVVVICGANIDAARLKSAL